MHHSEALQRLKEGNRRFANGLRSVEAMATDRRRQELAETGQKPFAIVLACADSRVPAELVFDCGLGDLFVVRVAGNIVAPSLIGSIEFAAVNFGTELCVVMGHSQCGAIAASVDAVTKKTRPDSDNVQNIVLEITPSVKAAIAAGKATDRDAIISSAITHNVQHSIEALTSRSRVLANLVASGRLKIEGATYDLLTGEVDFLSDVRPQSVPSAVSSHGARTSNGLML